MKQISKLTPMQLAYIISGVIVVGLILPWAKMLDFSSFNIGVATARGYNVRWLAILAIITLWCFITAYRKEDSVFEEEQAKAKNWLWGALVFGLLSLVPILSVGASLFGGGELSISSMPLSGFWVTLIGYVGLLVVSVRSLLAMRKAAPGGEQSVAD